MKISTESRDILKKDNENFFDIDFKQEKVKSSEKKQDNDFFDFSMKPDKKVSEDVIPAIDVTEFAEETQAELTEEIVEEITADVAADVTADVTEDVVDESVAEVQEESVNNDSENNGEDSDDDDVIIETSKYSPVIDETSVIQEELQSDDSVENTDESPAEIPAKAPVPEVQEKVSAKTPEEDDVIINVVSWGKVSHESQVKTVEPKKSNLVIDLEDGFEIKMCNFRGLSQKENDSDKNIKKN